mgnify:CR=1 FL=1
MSPLPAPEPRPERFEGHDGRECGEHRTTGPRAWCSNCQEWCYPGILCRGCELPLLRARAEQAEAGVAALRERLAHVRLQRDGWQQRAEQAEAALQRIHAFAVSIQEPGAPLFWPEMGRRIQQELNDHGAGSGRCPSCDHPVSLHQPDGCWFAVTEGTVGRDLVCPCSVPRTAPDQPEETR